MQNLFFCDYRTEDEDAPIAGSCFITKTMPEEDDPAWDAYLKEETRLRKASRLPLPLLILAALSLFAGVLMLPFLLLNLTEGLEKYDVLYLLCGGLLLLGGVLLLWNVRRARAVKCSAAYADHKAEEKRLEDKDKQALGVPCGALEIDILEEMLFAENDKKPADGGEISCFTSRFFAFADHGKLCLSDLLVVVEIPLSSLVSVSLDEESYEFIGWNKEEEWSAPRYRDYISDKSGEAPKMQCYRLVIRDPQGDFYLLLPAYDAEVIMRLTGIWPAVN